MTSSPFLQKSGYSNSDRLVIIHTDDIGMCHASVQAFKDLWELGTLTSGAAMVPSSSLLDADGYFHQWHQAVYDNAKPEAVETEVNAQIERALAVGIDVTHVDSHMGTIMSPLFIQSYIQAAASRLLPNMLRRMDAKGMEMVGMSANHLSF